MKRYVGSANGRSWTVRVEKDDGGHAVPLTHHVRHSPDGFAWGYGGSASTELARCILIDVVGIENVAMVDTEGRYHRFRTDVIEGLSMDRGFVLSELSVRSWLANNLPPEGPAMIDVDCPERHVMGRKCIVCGGVA